MSLSIDDIFFYVNINIVIGHLQVNKGGKMGKSNPRAARKMYLKKLTGEIVKYNTTSPQLKNISIGEFSTLSSRIAVKANYKPKATNRHQFNYNSGNYTTRPLYKGSSIWIVSSDLTSRWHTISDENEVVKQKNKQLREETSKVESKKPTDFKQLISYHQKQNVIKLSMQE